MKLKEFVHKCNMGEPAEITVKIFRCAYGREYYETLFTLTGNNLEYGYINKRFANAEVKSLFATEKNKFAVTIQPD